MEQVGRIVSRKQMSFKSGFDSRERERERERERDSQFNTAGGSEFKVRGAAVLNNRLANDVHRNGTHGSGTNDDRVLRALVRNEMCWLRYCGAAQVQSTEKTRCHFEGNALERRSNC